MIVDHRQSVALSGGRCEMAFEVDLPQRVGCCVFEPQPGFGCFARCRLNQTMTVQDGCDGTRGDCDAIPIEQAAGNFATAPSGMCLPQRNDGGFDLGGATCGLL